MIEFLKSLFIKTKVPTKKNVVFFDGDNVAVQVAAKLSTDSSYDYAWVKDSRATTPKKILQNKNIAIIEPSCEGKESTDSYIAMAVVKVCSDGAKSVTIVSNDTDFIDVIVEASKMFPDCKFTLMQHIDGPSRKLGKSFKIPTNASILKFKLKPVL
jgi:hypothetical protein